MTRREKTQRRAEPLRGVSFGAASGGAASGAAPYVVVVGGANIDIKVTIQGKTIPGTSNPGSAAVSLGGVGRNIAHNLARLDVAVKLISAVGHDPEGDRVLVETAAAGVDVAAVARIGRNTGVYSAVLDHAGELVIGVSAMEVIDALTQRALERKRRVIEGASYLVADCNLPRGSLQWLQQCAKRAGIGFLVEPVSAVKAERLNSILRRDAAIHTATPNRQQLEVLAGRHLRDMAAIQRAARALHDRGVENVMVGLGPAGALLSAAQSDGVRQYLIPAAQPKPVDVTGGGDAHVAGYVAGLAGGMRPLQAALLGQAAAGLAVSARETVSHKMAMPTLARGLAALKRKTQEI